MAATKTSSSSSSAPDPARGGTGPDSPTARAKDTKSKSRTRSARKQPSYEQDLVKEFGSPRAIEGHIRKVLDGSIAAESESTAKLDAEVKDIADRLGEIAGEYGALSPEKAQQVKDGKRTLTAGPVR